ncbi:MAG: hypothetical protein ABI647_15415 [Gemmatimonadota bacterium]
MTSLLALAAADAAAQAAPRTGLEVFEKMRAAYAGRWYHSLTFVQKTTMYGKDGTVKNQTWHESLRHTAAGGTRLRIDFGDLAEGNGVIYTADSVYVIRAGKVSSQQDHGNEFLPLIEGVYVQPAERTARELAGMKVDLGKVTSGSWHGRPAWVIGAAPDDATVPQIWIDRERLVVVRMLLQLGPAQPLMDVDLGTYVKAGGGWLATKVAMTVAGKPQQTEEYSGWKVNPELSPDLFEATKWTTAPHWVKK